MKKMVIFIVLTVFTQVFAEDAKIWDVKTDFPKSMPQIGEWQYGFYARQVPATSPLHAGKHYPFDKIDDNQFALYSSLAMNPVGYTACGKYAPGVLINRSEGWGGFDVRPITLDGCTAMNPWFDAGVDGVKGTADDTCLDTYVRWKAPTDGRYFVDIGVIKTQDPKVETRVSFYHNNDIIGNYNYILACRNINYAQKMQLSAGDTIEMRLLATQNYVDKDGKHGKNYTPFYAKITRITAEIRSESPERKSARQMRQEFERNLDSGWNTWNTYSVLSHVLLPHGLNIELRLIDKEGNRLQNPTIGKRGGDPNNDITIPIAHTYDGSYTELDTSWKGMELNVATHATKNDQLYVIVTPKTNVGTLDIAVNMLWGKSKITYDAAKGIYSIDLGDKKYNIYFSSKPISSDDESVKFNLKEKLLITTDQKMNLSEAQKILNKVKDANKFDNELVKGMQSALAWNTIYEPDRGRIITPVSRNWAIGFGGWVLFDWDTYFAVTQMAATGGKDYAYTSALAITDDVTDAGFVPNFDSANGKSSDRSQPPVGSMTINNLYKQYKEKWLLYETFDNLLSWNRWWPNARDYKGYLCWGTTPQNEEERKNLGKNGAQFAKYESGLDNSPMFDGIAYEMKPGGYLMLQADVGLMSMYIMDCRELAEIAAVLGEDEVVKELKARADKYSRSLETLWDEDFGMYLNKHLDTDKFNYRISPTNFYPLLSKVPTQQQAERMIKEHFFNPKEFYGEYIMPSISRNDPAFGDNSYWRGRIWAPMNFLVYNGLKNYDLPLARKKIAEKSKDLFLKSWLSKGAVYENYNSVNGVGDDVGNSDKFYHWGALLSWIAMDYEKNYSDAKK